MDPKTPINLEDFLWHRGVREPCSRCHGFGTTMYGSTATWRGGVGGAAMTIDVCDKCWGSGCSMRKGTDIRALEQRLRQTKAEAGRKFLEDNTHYAREMLSDIADFCLKQARKRKIPEGKEYWWRSKWEHLAELFSELAIT